MSLDPASESDEDRLPWHIDPERAADTFPARRDTTHDHGVAHDFKDCYHSSPSHKVWAVLPDELCCRVWVPNGRLAVENLSLFFQAWLGPPGLEYPAATEFLRYLTWPNQPENEHLAAIAIALDKILASNGGGAGTITMARTATGFDMDPPAYAPIYVGFRKGYANTDIEVPRYPDDVRTEAQNSGLDQGLLRVARRIQAAAATPPVEIELGMESYRGGNGELSVGVAIRDEPLLPRLYRVEDSDADSEGWSA